MLIALVAAASMVVSDILATIMVQAEAANRGWLAGFMDAAGWIVGITTTTISVNVLAGHGSVGNKAWVIGLVSCANVGGTKAGQLLGKRILKSKTDRLIAGAARSGR